MAPPGPDEERQYWPPPIWTAKKKPRSARADPPITRRVTLPKNVTVRYLAEITGLKLHRAIQELNRLGLGLTDNRSLDFGRAAEFLKKHGIGADREEK